MADPVDKNAPTEKQKTCFVISPIGEPGSPERERADLVFEFVIKEVLENEPFLFDVKRSDNIAETGLITNQIINRVIDADLVVADLTNKNANVFYELAIRHISEKPFVHIIEANQAIPFDNAGIRTIIVDVKDLRSVYNAKQELSAQVNSQLIQNGMVESPISVALNLSDMKKSGDREQIALSQILDQLGSINNNMRSIYSDIDYAKQIARSAESAAAGAASLAASATAASGRSTVAPATGWTSDNDALKLRAAGSVYGFSPPTVGDIAGSVGNGVYSDQVGDLLRPKGKK